jgi:hypothetical protein
MGERFEKGVRYEDDPLIGVGAGNRPDAYSNVMVGSVALPLPGTEYVIKPNTEDADYWPDDAGETLYIQSSNVTDVGIVIAIIGLDEDFIRKEEIVLLQGTNTVTLTGLWTRVNEIRNVGASPFIGKVTVTSSGGDVVIAALTEYQVSRQAKFSLGADQAGQILRLIGSMQRDQGNQDAGVDVVLRFRMQIPGDVFTTNLRWDYNDEAVLQLKLQTLCLYLLKVLSTSWLMQVALLLMQAPLSECLYW